MRQRRSETWSLSSGNCETAQRQCIDGFPLPPDAQQKSLATVREEGDERRELPTPTFRLVGVPGKMRVDEVKSEIDLTGDSIDRALWDGTKGFFVCMYIKE